MRVVRFVAAIVVAFVLACVLYTIVLVMAPFDRRRDAVNKVGRVWTGAWKWVLGIRVKVEGAENIREGGPFLFVSNHISYLDVLALYDDFPLIPRFLAKKTLIWAPIFGIAFYTLDHVYISRRDKSGHRDSLKALARKVGEGKSIFIFPGGRRAADGRIGEWKKGAFVMATELHVPLVPVAMIGSNKLHDIGDIVPRPGTIRIKIGRPISTAGTTYEDRDTLRDRAREAVKELLEHDNGD